MAAILKNETSVVRRSAQFALHGAAHDCRRSQWRTSCCTQYEMRSRQEPGRAARFFPDDCWNGKRCQKGSNTFATWWKTRPPASALFRMEGSCMDQTAADLRPSGGRPHPSIFDQFHPDVGGARLDDQSALSGRAPHMSIPVRFTHVSGDTVGEMAMKWLHCRTNLIENEADPPVLINMMDVTRTVEIERLLKLKDRMISGSCSCRHRHEIRNPLGNQHLSRCRGRCLKVKVQASRISWKKSGRFVHDRIRYQKGHGFLKPSGPSSYA